MAAPDLTTFKALSFDCYGTLIDWEAGLQADLSPLVSQLSASHPWAASPALALERFNAISEHLEAANPTQLYHETLSASLKQLAAELSLPASPALSAAAAAVATGPGRWPAFPDTVSGLLRLRKHFKLIILSNVNNANIASAVDTSLAPAVFDAVYTAEAIGAYKPSHANFEYLFAHARDDLGVDFARGELLHVARSLTADHVPAKELGFRSVWISRGGDREGHYGTGGDLRRLTEEGKLGFEWKFGTIGQFADEVDRQFAAKEKGR
ncbi:Haloacid dehalogenase-like hydrolase-domain-containing protein [Lasiosphaeris hirsuta]|uniref:Haloacid dehalogenase-like hydrolase-domain-containing protein n=1 Tax=Lasiosphaeris hirsuta TaxID=260670 RepID=A0AA40BCP6_9PEZI|nr:Haloacid dehalogenase-like hydrolase-domain-containing protein [Lasiosphaeris hirsuta]